MGFERIQSDQHHILNGRVDVSYDRFTTQFKLAVEGSIVYSRHLWFWPRHSAVIKIGTNEYFLNVYWLLIWRARLSDKNTIIIKELLPKRRRRSISLLGYSAFIILVRALILVFSP